MSVFRASNASDNHAVWNVPQPRPAYDDPYDGPTERLYDADPEPDPVIDRPKQPAGRGGIVLAVVLSVLALVASASASLVAWRAVAVASSAAAPASPSAAPAPSAASSAPAVAATPSQTPSTVAESSLDPSAEPSAQDTGYVVSYAQAPLQVRVGCASSAYLDLDEPRAGADQDQSDLRYDNRCGADQPTLMLGPGAESGGKAPGPDTDAAGCAQAIRTNPLSVDAAVPVQKGTVLCVLTSAIDAQDRGERPRMVLLEVTEVGDDGTAGMRATSWTVP